MKNTDILTGRIIQKILDAKTNKATEVSVSYGISQDINTERLIRNLFEYFPDSKITFKKLQFGYRLNVRMCWHKNMKNF